MEVSHGEFRLDGLFRGICLKGWVWRFCLKVAFFGGFSIKEREGKLEGERKAREGERVAGGSERGRKKVEAWNGIQNRAVNRERECGCLKR